MVSKYLKLGDIEATYNRLKKVIVDFTNEIEKIYGKKFAADLLQKLNEYVDLVDKYVNAQMAGNNTELNRIIQLLYQNVDSRAAAEASITNLSENEWKNRLRDLEVKGLINESTALFSNNIASSVDIFTDLLTQAESMAEFVARALFDNFTKAQGNQ